MKRGILNFINFYLILSLGWAVPAIPQTKACTDAISDLENSLKRFRDLLKSWDTPEKRKKSNRQRGENKPRPSDGISGKDKRVLRKNSVDAQFIISSIKVMEFINQARNLGADSQAIKAYRAKINAEKKVIEGYSHLEGYSGQIFIKSLEDLNKCLEPLERNNNSSISDCVNKEFKDERMVALKQNLEIIESQYKDKNVKTVNGTQTYKRYDLTFKQDLRFQYLKTLTDYHEVLRIKDCKSPYGQVEMDRYLSQAHCALIGNNKKVDSLINDTHKVIVELINSQPTGGKAKSATGNADGDGISDSSGSFSRYSNSDRPEGSLDEEDRRKKANDEKLNRMAEKYVDEEFEEAYVAPLDLGNSGGGANFLNLLMASMPLWPNLHNNQSQNNFIPGMQQNNLFPGIDWTQNNIKLKDRQWYNPAMEDPYLFRTPIFHGFTDQLQVNEEGVS